MTQLKYGQTISLKSYHGRYLVAEPDGRLDANRTAIGPWEKFTVLNATNPSDTGAVRFGSAVTLKSAHGKYVAAFSNGTAFAHENHPSNNTQFTILDADISSNTGYVSNIDAVAFRSSHSRYLVAEGGSFACNANRSGVGPWEKWSITSHVAIPPYEVEFRLDHIRLYSDGDAGIDGGDLFWNIKFNGHTVTHRGRDDVKTLGGGKNHSFASIIRSGESTTYRKRFSDKQVALSVYASFTDRDRGGSHKDDHFGSQTKHESLLQVLLQPGQRTMRLKQNNTDVEIYYTLLVKTWNGSQYVTPAYPTFSLSKNKWPEQDLSFLIGLNGDEIDLFEQIALGNKEAISLNLGQKIYDISKAIENLPDSNSGQVESALVLGNISLEITASLFASTLVGGAISAGVFGVINLIAQPLIFSSTNYNNTMFIANYSRRQIKISDIYREAGQYKFGPKDGVIPGRTDDKVYVAVLVFEKSFGLTGSEAVVEFGAYGTMPKTRVGFSLPYRDDAAIRRRNKCAVQIAGSNSIKDFYNKSIDVNRSKGVTTASDRRNGVHAFCSLTSETAEFTQMQVVIKDA